MIDKKKIKIMKKSLSKLINIKSFFSFVFLSLILIEPTLAGDWKIIQNDDESTTYLDIDSIIVEGTTREYWEKTLYKKPQNLKEPGTTFSSTKSQFIIDCPKRTFSLIETILYNSSGEIVYTFKEGSKSNPIPPDALGEKIRKAICPANNKPKSL